MRKGKWFLSTIYKPKKRMIMSKKKRKITNTFLQSKNKKNMKISSSKTNKHLPIKFDDFGKVRSLVNRNEVLTTETKVSSPILVNQNTYGCESVKREELPSYLNKVISKMRLPNPIKVPIRKRGMTSSGKEMSCHINVNTLTEVYGGKRMIGYLIGKTDDRIDLFSHSVWMTPENKLCDVTRKTELQNSFHPNQNDLDYQYFIPILVITDTEFVMKDMTIDKNYKRDGYMSGFYGYKFGGVNNDFKKMKWNNPTLKDLVGEEKVFYEKDLIDEGISKKEIEVYKKEKKKSGENSFSLPSLFTGKRLYYDISSILKTPLIYTRMLVQR